MNSNKYFQVLLFLAIVVFLATKGTHLNIPYFWDESWVYAPAVLTMAEVGPSLSPSALPADLSRGHPLLFHFVGGVWLNMFGTSIVSSHSFALFISTFFLLAFHWVLEKVYNARIALVSTVLVAFQSIFYAQSSLLLPETLLTAASFLAVSFFVLDRWYLYVLFASIAVLTKESGVTVPIAAAIVCQLTQTRLYPDFSFGAFSKKTAIALAPLGVFLLFMLIQFLQRGWFLYPDHVALTSIHYTNIIDKGQEILDWIIHFQGRGLFFTVTLATCFGHLIFGQQFVSMRFDQVQKSFIYYQGGFLFLFFLFCATNHLTLRYLLPLIPPLTALLTLSIFYLSEGQSKLRYTLFLIILTNLLCYTLSLKDSDIGDTSLSYLNFSPLQKEVVHYLEDKDLYDHPIYTGFLLSYALGCDKCGYRGSERPFSKLNQWEVNYGEYYQIFANIELNSENYQDFQNSPNAKLVKRFEKEQFWFEIYLMKR